MKRLVHAPKARANIFAGDAYIAERNPLAAKRLILVARQLTSMPKPDRDCAELRL